MHQLNLFTADVVPFPIYRDRRLVLRLAKLMVKLGQARGEDRWYRECRKIDLRLQRQGMPQEEILEQINRLADAVRVEMYGRPWERAQTS